MPHEYPFNLDIDAVKKALEQSTHFLDNLKIQRTLMCCNLESALSYFHQLPDEGHEHGMPIGERNTMLFAYSHLRWHLKAEQIELLNGLYDANQALLNNVFGYVDHPEAIARIVNQIGDILKGDGFILFAGVP